MQRYLTLIGFAVATAASVSCSDALRQSTSPVLVLVSSITGDDGKVPIFSNVTDPVNDLGKATLQAVMKNVAVQPTANNQVIISRYHVQFTRSDGRNTQGVDVPYAFDGAFTGSVSPNQDLIIPFDLVRHAAKNEPPLTQLAAGGTVVSMVATITFYGQDIVGNGVSAVGTTTVNFGRFTSGS
jgi:hypothetical protein